MIRVYECVIAIVVWMHMVSALHITPDSEKKVGINQQRSLSDAMLWSNLIMRLRNASKPLGKNGNQQTILMFGNYDYRFVIVNAMERFHMLGVTNYAVICTDDKLFNLMQSVGRPCEIFRSSNLKSLWQARLHILSDLLAGGTDVLMTDADAVWRSDPIPLLKAHFKDADIFASRGSFPANVGKKLGATVCMGFAYFTASAAVSQFVKNEVISRFQGDDQEALNRAMIENGISFKQKLNYTKSIVIDTGTIPSKELQQEILVSFLDHRRFQRLCEFPLGDDVYVAHCWSSKVGKAKLHMLVKYKMVYIKDEWESTNTTTNFTDWITNIKSVDKPSVV